MDKISRRDFIKIWLVAAGSMLTLAVGRAWRFHEAGISVVAYDGETDFGIHDMSDGMAIG